MILPLLVGTSNSASIPMGILMDHFEPSLCYEVDLLLLILTKLVVDELRSTFEIPNKINILLPNDNLVPSISSPEGITIFANHMFTEL